MVVIMNATSVIFLSAKVSASFTTAQLSAVPMAALIYFVSKAELYILFNVNVGKIKSASKKFINLPKRSNVSKEIVHRIRYR